MNLPHILKRYAETLPPAIGIPLARTPFSLRLGPAYRLHQQEIAAHERRSATEAEAWTVNQLRKLVANVHANVPFYREHWKRAGGISPVITSLADFQSLPIVTKEDFRRAPMTARQFRKGLPLNTGGTTGEPLEFQVEPNAFAREWAHMHRLWKARGYRQEHLKLTLRGKHFAPPKVVVYNAVHNELIVNADVPMLETVAATLDWDGPPIRWVHGYPSLVAEFASVLGKRNDAATGAFQARLFGALLGSEYPAPTYMDLIRHHLSVNVVSWYGHSEMAILAGEATEGVYRSFATYGYAEAVPTEDRERFRLVCTSFHNLSHPFIRYDTGDVIAPVRSGPEGLSFRILDGRVGDFVLDRHGRRHSLTAIIFGRHHSAFSDIVHVQLAELAPGRIRLLVTPSDPHADAEEIRAGFDFTGLDIDWEMQILPAPIRSATGKIKLKLEPSNLP